MKVVKSLDIINDYIEKLEQENKQLKGKIDKAINYIENECAWELLEEESEELLEILGDKENENN